MENSTINKNHELYKASLSAFFKNEADNDKLILGLSVAGIGFFISLLTEPNEINTIMSCLIILSLVTFSLTVFFVLCIFYYNKKQILKIIKNTGKEVSEISELVKLDKIKYISFYIAIITAIIFTIVLIFQQEYRGTYMIDESNIDLTNVGVQQDGISGLAEANKTPEQNTTTKSNQPSTQPESIKDNKS